MGRPAAAALPPAATGRVTAERSATRPPPRHIYLAHACWWGGGGSAGPPPIHLCALERVGLPAFMRAHGVFHTRSFRMVLGACIHTTSHAVKWLMAHTPRKAGLSQHPVHPHSVSEAAPCGCARLAWHSF